MVLEIKNVRKFYGDKEALKPLYVTFTPGVYGLLGPNGAGEDGFWPDWYERRGKEHVYEADCHAA